MADVQTSNEGDAQLLRDIHDALTSCRRALTTSPYDQGDRRDVSWVYGVLVGWECEDEHEDAEHDGVCEGDAALHEIAERWGWDTPDELARHRRYRAAVRAVTEAVSR